MEGTNLIEGSRKSSKRTDKPLAENEKVEVSMTTHGAVILGKSDDSAGYYVIWLRSDMSHKRTFFTSYRDAARYYERKKQAQHKRPPNRVSPFNVAMGMATLQAKLGRRLIAG